VNLPTTVVAALIGAILAASGLRAAEAPPPIERVELAPNRAFVVNGKPFFPLMAWLQDAENFPILRACGMNTTAGYWPKSSGTADVTEYLPLVAKAGLYGVMPFDARLKGHAALLAYIHDDEPDLPRQVSDAEVLPGEGLRVNAKTPLWKIVDGVTHSWSVLDPLEGAAVTIRAKAPVTVRSLVVHLTISPGLAVAKDVTFEADGKEVLRAALEAKKGPQTFDLAAPATFRDLRLTVRSVHPGKETWGSVGEIEGLDAGGRNVLAAPPRWEPRATPQETLAKYRAFKAADPSRPVFLTLTGNFHPHFDKYAEDRRRALYPAYVAAADVVGYDIYPIYGWNKPEWLYLVSEATGLLVGLAAPRPVYAWIETSKGGQWTGPLENQKDVTGAHIRAEVWMSICRGATAIGYFTHIWKPAYRQFGVPEANQEALREVNGQVTRLAPAILGQAPPRRVAVEAEGGVKVDALARAAAGGGDLYVFAVNGDERLKPARVAVKVDGLAAGTAVEVVDEGRTLKSAAGEFADAFEPLAVHVYRIAGGGGK